VDECEPLLSGRTPADLCRDTPALALLWHHSEAGAKISSTFQLNLSRFGHTSPCSSV